MLLALGLALFVFGLVGLASAVNAQAEDDPLVGINCSGKVAPFEGGIFPDEFSYEFGCDKDISAFSIVSNRQVGSFSTEVIGVDPAGEPGLNQDFFCTGQVPSFGFGCYGNPGKTPVTVITAGNKAIGEFSMFNSVCDANVQPTVWGIAQTEYSTTNDLVDPPVVRKWLATSEPFLLDATAIRCKVLNPKAKAKKICAKVRKAKNPRARAVAKRACDRARAAVKDAS
jgi:hypothetical protein